MSLVNRDNLINILSNTKDKIDNKINTIKVDSFETTTKEKYTKNTDIPYNFYNGSAVSIGTDIYLLGGYTNFKYDTTTNTYTKLTDIPYAFDDGSAVAIGTDIYLLGSADSYHDSSNVLIFPCAKYNFKYDTTTNTYSRLSDIPYNFYNGSAVSIGTDIYILGGVGSTNNNYKYDTTTNSYTKMTNIPYKFYEGSAVAIGTDIYLLGSNNSIYSNYNYKYDTTTNSYTKLTDIPYLFYDASAVAIGTDIYILGNGFYNGSYHPFTKYNYKYDTTTNTYTANTVIPYSFYYGSAVAIGTDIYLLGGSDSRTNNYTYSLPFTTNGIVKPTNHSIYTSSKTYTSSQSSIIPIGKDYYTEYNGNYIIKNTYPISSNGNTKMYIKSGAILNGKEVPCETEGWQDINLLEYM